MNNSSKKNKQQPLIIPSMINPNIIQKEDQTSKESNTYSSTTYEYVTKKRKTLYDSSTVHLESPKKKNPNKINDIDEHSSYILLIKRIAKQLGQRIRLPTCKIIKVYQPYRTLIMRIAEGIKKSAKNLNYWNKCRNDINQKDNIYIKSRKTGNSLFTKEQNNNSKTKIENNENIKSLSNINDSEMNVNFIDEFQNYLGQNNIEILKESKMPSFKSEKNEYLLANIQFWKKYINFISIKFKGDITFYNFINLIEQFHFWNKDPNDAEIFKKLIIKKIETLFEKNVINDFLLTHKLKNLDDLFAKYKNLDNNNHNSLEIKIGDDCECPTCQDMKEKLINTESIKFPETNNGYKSKNTKITDYYGLTIKMKPFVNKSQKKIMKFDDDKKILDYFNFSKVKTEKKNKEDKKEKIKQKSKSRSKSKSKKNKNAKKNSINNNKKNSNVTKKMQEILDLLNLDSEK